VNSLLTIKLALKYANMRDVESMRAIARAHQNRNLADFEKALRDYREGALAFTPPSFPCSVPVVGSGFASWSMSFSSILPFSAF
jgi:hypothetical protein